MKPASIMSLGEVLWDLFPDGERFGGAPANFASHAAIQGADVTMFSAVGDDRHGHDAVNILKGYGIDVSLMQTIPNVATGTVGVELDANGKPTFTIHKDSAWDQLEWNHNVEARLASVDAIYFGTLGQRGETSRTTISRIVTAAAAAGLPRVLDINLRPPFFDANLIRDSIRLASILKLSDDELEEVCSACGVSTDKSQVAALQSLRESCELDLVILTKGADGATLIASNETIEQPGVAANVIDTVGAGDSFAASFLLGELRGDDRSSNLKRACEIAAAACSHSGGVPMLRDDESPGRN